MKIFIYDYTDEFDKRHYQVVEISDDDANDWINIDYERRLAEAKPGEVISRRKPQEIQNEIDNEFIKSDRRNMSHKTHFPTVHDEEGNEVSILEFMEDESPSSQKQYEEEARLEELREKINKALAILTEKQRRRVLMRYVDEMTLQEIADIEGCDISTINESIEGAIKKIRKNF